MKQNVGTADRYIRIALGSFLLSAGCARMVRNTDLTAVALGLVGGIMLSEGVLGSCPLYTAMGIDTHAPKPAPAERDDDAVADQMPDVMMGEMV